jgi:hypothetical protein
MKKLFLIALGIIVATTGLAFASGTQKEVGGEAARGNTNPFYATRASMRFQCMWYQNEIDENGPITKIEFKFHSYIGTPPSDFEGYKVILCHSSKDKLTNDFKKNYDFKTPVTVYEGPLTIPANMEQDDWFTVCTPTSTFNYNNKNNMLMEVVWTSAEGCRNLFWISVTGQPGRVRAYSSSATTGVLLANQGEIARITISKPAVAPTSLGRIRALYN